MYMKRLHSARIGLTLAFVALLTATILAMGGCNGGVRHAAVVVDSALYQGIDTIHATEQQMLCGANSCASVPEKPVTGYTHERSVAFNQKLLPAAEAGRQLNVRLAAWKPGTPVPVEVQQLISGLGNSLSAVVVDFPPGAGKEKVLAQIATVQEIALKLLADLLAVTAK